MNVYAIIVSAGKGHRFMEGKKKQFFLLGGKPILTHTLEKFEACPSVHSILLVVGEEDMDYCMREIIERYHFQKVSQIVPGGKRRQESVKNGIEALPKDADLVVIHDGVRPFVTKTMIEDSIHSATRNGAVIFALPVRDTIKMSNPDGTVLKTLDRESLWQVQTPQTFQVNVIKKAFYRATEDGFIGTDDASLVERLGIKVHILPGTPTNIKITTAEDLLLANAFLQMNVPSKEDSTGGVKTT